MVVVPGTQPCILKFKPHMYSLAKLLAFWFLVHSRGNDSHNYFLWLKASLVVDGCWNDSRLQAL